MVNKKFELVKGDFKTIGKIKLFRIRAKIAFGIVAKGELGGYIEKEANLSENGDAWVFGNAQISGNARVSGDAWVSGRIDLKTNINIEIPRILLDTQEKVERYLKMLKEFEI